MAKTFPKNWDHNENEEKIYQKWEDSGFFKPENKRNTTSTESFHRKDTEKEADSSQPQTASNNKPFVIMMPPPNVTGKLHVGHALFVTLEDIMTRYHRLIGDETLWLPGVDHAGIATQTVVDKALKKEGINRRDLGREKFVKKVWEWKKEYGGIITQQIRRLGASCDWSRERFTLDEGLSKSVNEAFVKLYEKGLIYRGEYIVNWCPKCGTAIADDEVEHETQQAKLYYFKYDKNFPIIIATTRPETKFGDTAVAVNPSDERYKKYVGQEFDVDLDGVKRKIKVIVDRSIDTKFGTGAVGLTPAHSAIDWKIAEANDLPKIKMINEIGKIINTNEKYDGLKVLEARDKIIDYLKSNNLLEKEQEIENNLSICYRCGGAIEPLPSLQWFVKMSEMAKRAKKAVEDGEIEIIPKRFEKVYFNWLDNIRDWCISRQLWWGHRIPVWYENSNLKPQTSNLSEKEIYVGENPPTGWVQDEDVLDTWFSSALWPFSTLGWPMKEELGFNQSLVELIKSDEKTKTYRLTKRNLVEGAVCKVQNSQTNEYFGVIKLTKVSETTIGGLKYNQEGHEKYKDKEDFIATMQKYYPKVKINDETPVWEYDFEYSKTSDLDKFYPTSVLETGYDILFFWVAKMIMMGQELTGKAPFKTVYLHGLVRDEHNRKMSKSLGNVLDPLDEIEKYGTDALRMALVVGATPGNDIAIGDSKIRGFRNFSNKVWNASRFVTLQVSGGDLQSGEIGSGKIDNLNIDNSILTTADKGILEKHQAVIQQITVQLNKFQFSMAGKALYNYFWHEFCDSYIESAKKQLGQLEIRNLDLSVSDNTKKILVKTLSETLVMLHPFVPFVTEAVWQDLREICPALAESIMTASWPK